MYNVMATLEEYVAQATNAYKPAQTAIQNQLGSLDSNYQTAQNTINRNYEQQQKQLETQRNQAAEASSLAAAGSGGSFGGQGNLARRKYYEQSFVPAQTQLQTNQSNELEKARQDYENQRTSLNTQLSNLEAQANQMALQKYWEAVEAEKQRAAQLAAARASAVNPFAYLDDGYGNGGGGSVKSWNFGNGYTVVQDPNTGQASYRKNGQVISAANFMNNANHNWNLWNDIWNNGVKTQGVGSDTVSLMSKLGNNQALKKLMTSTGQLSYLNNIRY